MAKQTMFTPNSPLSPGRDHLAVRGELRPVTRAARRRLRTLAEGPPGNDLPGLRAELAAAGLCPR